MLSTLRPRLEIVERRRHRRRTMAWMAFARDAEGRSVPCCIRNLSDTGMMLEFPGTQTVVLDRVFDVVLSDRRTTYGVRLIWRQGSRAGVLFHPPEA